MKKNYIKPTTTVIRIETESRLLASQGVTSVESNTDISYGGGGNQAARVKANSVEWDDWE